MPSPIFVDRLFYTYSQLQAHKTICNSMEAAEQVHRSQDSEQPSREFYTKARLHHAIHVVVSLVFAGLHVLKALADALEAGVALDGRAVLTELRTGGTKLGYEAGIIVIHVAGIFAPRWVQEKTNLAIKRLLLSRGSSFEMRERSARSTEDGYHVVENSAQDGSPQVADEQDVSCVQSSYERVDSAPFRLPLLRDYFY